MSAGNKRTSVGKPASKQAKNAAKNVDPRIVSLMLHFKLAAFSLDGALSSLYWYSFLAAVSGNEWFV